MQVRAMVLVLTLLTPSLALAQSGDAVFDAWIHGRYQDVINLVVGNPAADPHYIYAAADSLRQLQRYDEAYQEFQRLVNFGSVPWVYVGWSGQWYLNFGYPESEREQNALLAAQWAADSAPGWVLPLYNLGFMEAATAQYSSAAAHMDAVTSSVPWFSWSKYYAGRTYIEVFDSGQGPYSNEVVGKERLCSFVIDQFRECPRPSYEYLISKRILGIPGDHRGGSNIGGYCAWGSSLPAMGEELWCEQ